LGREIGSVPIEDKEMLASEPKEFKDINPVDNYNSQDINKRYLTHTSVYLSLQSNLIKLIKLINPESILELGFGGAQTAIKVAKEYPNKRITVVNTDSEMTTKAVALAEDENIENIEIMNEDVNNFIKKNLGKFDFIYLLYNFHHIPDTTKRKREKSEFLMNCYDNMARGSYFCIAEAFLPESCSESQLEIDTSLEELYVQRAKETEASTFWSYLKGIEYEDVRTAWEEAEKSRIREEEAYVKVKTQTGEYMVKKSWLIREAKAEKFSVIIDKDINSIGDAVLLLKKI